MYCIVPKMQLYLQPEIQLYFGVCLKYNVVKVTKFDV